MARIMNWTALETFVREGADVEEMHPWYDMLYEYKLNGMETPQQIETLFLAQKILINFSFTAAEELKDVAEQEAIRAADREAQYEDANRKLKEELENLREKMTDRDTSTSSETFRAQIAALREENSQLALLNRERDRELADQRDRFESLMARTEGIHKERDFLLYNRAQLEESIRDMKRRLTATSEESANQWQAHKLRQRNEQTLQLSQQIHVVVAQNNALRGEVERVSTALEEATRLLADTTHKYQEVCTQIIEEKKKIAELEDEIRGESETITQLRKQIEKQEESPEEDNEAIQLRNELIAKEEEIRSLSETLAKTNEQLEWALAKNEKGTVREEHLTYLTQQLNKATKEARSLLGTSMRKEEEMRVEGGSPPIDIQAFIHDKQLQIEAKNNHIEQLEKQIEEREQQLAGALAQMNAITKMTLGDSADHVKNVLQQLAIRDEQIHRLNRTCSLLHIELAQKDDGTWNVPHMETKEEDTRDEQPGKRETPQKTRQRVRTHSQHKEQYEEEVPQKTIRTTHDDRSNMWQEQAILLAQLHFESISLIQELELKDRQLRDAERNVREGKRATEQAKEQLRLAYQQIVTLNTTKGEEQQHEDFREELTQLRIMADTIRQSGTDAQRRIEEMTRKLIGEQNTRLRIARTLTHCEQKLAIEERKTQLIRQRLISTRSHADHTINELQRQLNVSWIEESRLRTALADSVPRSVYQHIHSKYTHILRNYMNENKGEDLPIQEQQSPIIPDIAPPLTLDQQTQQQIEYYKNTSEINEEQAEFWRTQVEILSHENAEMKKLMERMENESDTNAILASMQRHLLSLLREQQETSHEQQREKRRHSNLQRTFAIQSEQWNTQRIHLHNVTRIMLRIIKTKDDDQLKGITVSHIETFQKKIEQLMREKEQIDDTLQMTKRAREDAEETRSRLGAMEQARNIILHNNANINHIEAQLRQLILDNNHLKAELEEKSERKEKDPSMEDIIQQLEHILQHIPTTQHTEEYQPQPEQTREPPRRNEMETERTREISPEDDTSDSDFEQTTHTNTIVKNIVHDNSKMFEEKINQIRETTDICIRGYKEQLEQKDYALHSLNAILLKGQQNTITKIVHVPQIIKDEKMEKEITQLKKDKARLEKNIDRLEEVNRQITQRKDDKHTTHPSTHEVGSQTMNEEVERIVEEDPRVEELEIQLRDLRTQMNTDTRNNHNLIHKLRTANKELLRALEELKEQALQDIKMYSNRSDSGYEGREIGLMQHENEQLNNMISSMRNTIDQLKKEIERLEKQKKRETDTEWNERKKKEEYVERIKKELEELKKKERESRENIQRMEKRITEAENTDRYRMNTIQQLENKLRTAQRENRHVQDNRDKEKIAILQQQVDSLRVELKDVTIKLRKGRDARKTEMNTEQKKTKTKVDDDLQQIEKLRTELSQVTAKYNQVTKHVQLMEQEKKMLEETISSLSISNRSQTPTPAIMILNDKLHAKELEIRSLKSRINELERKQRNA